MAVLPPGRVAGTSLTTCALLNPRVAPGIASSTLAPSLNVRRESRSWAPSKEPMNDLAASLTAPHCAPMEPDTSSTRDKSTILRVASPELVTLTWVKLAIFMNDVGIIVEAVTVTTLMPLAVFTEVAKKLGSAVGSGDAEVAMYPAGNLTLNIRVASPLGSPPLRLRAAASAAPSTALLNWAFTTYIRPLSTARPVKSSKPVRSAAMYTRAKPSCLEVSSRCLFILLASSDISTTRSSYQEPQK